jgi:hypothetical protein
MIMMTHRSIGTYALVPVRYSGLHCTAQHRLNSCRSALVMPFPTSFALSVCLCFYLPFSHILHLSPLSLTLSLSPSLFFLFFSFSSPSDESCQKSVRSHFSTAQSVRSNAPSNVSTSLNVQLYSMVVLHFIATSVFGLSTSCCTGLLRTAMFQYQSYLP